MADRINCDSVAQDQMLAFAEQIEQFRLSQRERHYASFGRKAPAIIKYPTRRSLGELCPRQPRNNGVPVEHAARWLEICEILCRDADDFDNETRRGWVITCRLLGLGWSEVQNALRDVYHFGVDAAAEVWAPYLGWLDARFLGVVYTANVPGRGEFIKIGFTGDPERRMKELARTQHAPVQLLSTRPGTMLHEWALHHQMRHAVEPEWYPVGELPVFLMTREFA